VLKVKESFGGKTGLCPVCRAHVKVPKIEQVSDDDIVALLSRPAPATADPDPTLPRSVTDDIQTRPLGAVSRGKQKPCPKCEHLVSLSFAYCPRCGAPLASLKAAESDT
jgi:hypothetical protein